MTEQHRRDTTEKSIEEIALTLEREAERLEREGQLDVARAKKELAKKVRAAEKDTAVGTTKLKLENLQQTLSVPEQDYLKDASGNGGSDVKMAM